MTPYVIAFGSGCVVAGTVVSLFFWGVKRRLVRRLTDRHGLLATITDLETRRETHDSGRDTMVRPKAGPPARVRELLGRPARPGSLSQYNTERSRRLGTQKG